MPEDEQVQGGEWHIEEEKSNFIATADDDREIRNQIKLRKVQNLLENETDLIYKIYKKNINSINIKYYKKNILNICLNINILDYKRC